MATLASGQGGVVSTKQLLAVGLTYRQIESWVASGRLHRLHQGVYAVGHTNLTDRGYLRAALLATPAESFLSHRAAGAVMGYQRLYRRGIEVTVPGGSVCQRPGLVLHRTRSVDPADIQVRDGMRVSAPARMLIERAGEGSCKALERLVTVSVQKRLLRLDTPAGLAVLEAALARHPRHPGVAQLKTVLRGYRRTEDSKSGLERAFDAQVLTPHPEIPEPERNVAVDIWEIDRLWRSRGLAVELDGRPYHVAVRDMEKDRIKDAALQRLGLKPVRFTDLRIEHDIAGVLDDVCFFLGITLR